MFAIQWVLDDIMTMYEMGESEIMNVFLYNGDEQYRDETINYLNNNRFVLRSHGALGWATPIDTLHRLHGDNVPAMHT